MHSHRPDPIRFCLAALALTVALQSAALDSSAAASSMESAIVELTNQERFKSGLPELKTNPQLTEAARKHAVNMAAQQTLEHKLDGKTHSDRIADAGYAWISARENIAFNQEGAKEVVEAWMKSPGHRENILAKDISEIGVGIARDSKGELYFCQDFALPQTAAVIFKFTLKNGTGQSITINTGTPKPSSVGARETMTYTLTTADTEPLVKLSGEGMSELAFKLENGAAYRVEKDGADFKLFKIEK